MAAIQQQGMANQSKPPSLGKRKIDKFQVLSEADKELFQRQARMLRPNDIVCGRAFSKLCKNWKRSGWKIFHQLIEQNSSDYCKRFIGKNIEASKIIRKKLPLPHRKNSEYFKFLQKIWIILN